MAAVGQATRGCLHVECRAWDSQVQELRLPRSGEKRRFGTVSNRQDRQRGRNLTDYLFMLDSRLKVRVARATLVFFFGGGFVRLKRDRAQPLGFTSHLDTFARHVLEGSTGELG